MVTTFSTRTFAAIWGGAAALGAAVIANNTGNGGKGSGGKGGDHREKDSNGYLVQCTQDELNIKPGPGVDPSTIGKRIPACGCSETSHVRDAEGYCVDSSSVASSAGAGGAAGEKTPEPIDYIADNARDASKMAIRDSLDLSKVKVQAPESFGESVPVRAGTENYTEHNEADSVISAFDALNSQSLGLTPSSASSSLGSSEGNTQGTQAGRASTRGLASVSSQASLESGGGDVMGVNKGRDEYLSGATFEGAMPMAAKEIKGQKKLNESKPKQKLLNKVAGVKKAKAKLENACEVDESSQKCLNLRQQEEQRRQSLLDKYRKKGLIVHN